MKRNTLLSVIALASLATVSACDIRADETPAPAAEDTAAAPQAAEAAPSAEPVAFTDLTGDATAGERVFALCRSCHVLEEGVNRVGPSLYNVVGRDAGTVEGFNYSDANKGSGLVWTPEQLYTYLEDPQATIPGTSMAFPGIKDPQDRADLVAYLVSTSS